MAIVLPRNFSLVLAEEDGSCFQRITPSSTANNEGFFRSCNGFSTLRKVADVPKVWHSTMLPSEWLMANHWHKTIWFLVPPGRKIGRGPLHYATEELTLSFRGNSMDIQMIGTSFEMSSNFRYRRRGRYSVFTVLDKLLT